MFFSTPTGKVQRTYPGYHVAWNTLRLRKVGTQLTLFADGMSLGACTMPAIINPTAWIRRSTR